MTLTIDFETRSILDIRKVGIYRYVEHPSTRVLCFAADYEGYSGTYYSTELADLPGWLRRALADNTVPIHAHNAAVERLVIQRILHPRQGWPRTATERFRCSAARAARLALPRALETAGAALGLDVVKDKAGTLVMRRLSRPVKWTDAGPVYDDSPDKLMRLGDYCAQDVRAEMAIDNATFPMPETEEHYYQLTERINDRGVKVDVPLVKRLIWRAGEALDELNAEMRLVTNGRVNKLSEVAKLKAWIFQETGTVIETMRKEDMEELTGDASFPPHVNRAIAIRSEGARSSVAKLIAILNRVSADGRLRGAFVFNGTSTGRYSSMGVQLQNLKRDTLKDYEDAFRHRLEEFTLDEISQCLRLCFIADDGKVFVDADFNAIEARGVGWLFGAKKLLEYYRTGRDPYCEMGTIIYGRTITKADEWERFVGKQTILGCGYGMGVDKFYAQCVKFGKEVPYPDCEKAVYSYRDEFHQIKKGWYEVGDAAMDAVENPGKVFPCCKGKLSFLVKDGYLQMKLPNGRRLFYKSPRIDYEFSTKYGKRPVLSYMAQHQTTKQWVRERTWGGKLTENAVQGFCRDLLFESMDRIEIDCEIDIVLSVHDQLVMEVPEQDKDWATKVVQGEMEYVPEWAAGFPIKAEPKITLRFGK